MFRLLRVRRAFSAISEIDSFSKQTFKDFNFPSYILETFNKAGYTHPTEIQSKTWPIILKGNDLIGIAKTGSGKTMAFLAPSLMHIKENNEIVRGDGPITLVLSPTRELAMQIKNESELFEKYSQTMTACVYGGADRWTQIRQLRNKPQTVVATPGRLIDFIDSGMTNLSKVSYLVIDEADRMLDMGFEPQLRTILSEIRSTHQTLMFTATWPKEVQGLARDFLNNPVEVIVGSQDLSANPDIHQTIEFTNDFDKTNRIENIARSASEKREKILIFCDTKMECKDVFYNLSKLGLNVEEIHGDKDQRQRDFAIKNFKNGISNILVATDVASRGLDIKDIKIVINMSMPRDIASYVHRIGRTGRAGIKGQSLTFFTKEDPRIAKELIKILRQASQEVPDELLSMASNPVSNNYKFKATRSSDSFQNSQRFKPQGYRNNDELDSSSRFKTKYDEDDRKFSREVKTDRNQDYGEKSSQNRDFRRPFIRDEGSDIRKDVENTRISKPYYTKMETTDEGAYRRFNKGRINEDYE